MSKAVRSPFSRAFSLIELLVVVLIIGLLIGLLLPALAASREAGRRAQCVNNLRQLGIALSSYESTHSSFPLGGVNRLVKGAPNSTVGRTRMDWGTPADFPARLDPSSPQQSPLYNTINFKVPSDAGGPDKAAGFTLWRTSLAVFLCPSDSGHDDGFRVSNAEDATWGQYPHAGPPIDPATGTAMTEVPVSSYIGSFGDNYSMTTLVPSSPWESPCGVDLPAGQVRIGWPGFWGTTYGCDEAAGRDGGGKLRGIFDYRTGQLIRLADITDGTSMTVLAGETLAAQRADVTLWEAHTRRLAPPSQ